MGFPTQILGTMRPVFSQQPIATAAATSPQQFQMTMNPSFISMRPNVVSAVGQPQQVRVENFPTESIVSQRVVQLSATQGYNMNQAGGVYNRQPEQIALSEGSLSPQPQRITIIEDCQMCQKALTLAHSDTTSPSQKSSPSSTISDGLGRPVIRSVVTGTIPEGNMEQQLVRTRAVCIEDQEPGKIHAETFSGISQKVENSEASMLSIPQVVMTNRVQVPYGVVMAKYPQSSPASSVQNLGFQSQLQVIPETTFNRPLNSDFAHVGMPLQKDSDSPKEFSPKVATGCPVDDSISLAYDNLRKVDGKLDNLQINPSEVVYNDEQNKTIADPRKEDMFQIHVGEALNMHSLYTISAVGASNAPSEDAAGSNVYSGVESNMLPYSEWNDNHLWSQQRICGDRDDVGDILDNSSSRYIYQDPWNISPDSQYPPPKPSKIQLKMDNTGLRDSLGDNHLFNASETSSSNYMDSLLENSLDNDGAYHHTNSLNEELSPNHSLSNTGSAEEQIKRELQAVAEGVAASVFNSSVLSNPELSENPTSQNANAETQPNKFDEIKTNLSEKISLGFPSSGIGRLQIIKNRDLEELQELGSGTFGTVYHGKWRGTDVAIKRINDRCFSEKPSELERMRDDFWNEAIKLADLHHPNVVAFYGVVLDGPDGSVATVTEYMVNGSLRNALQRNDRILDKRKRLLIGMDVAFGMEYLHGKNILHFDLKSDNLLVNLRDPHRPICKVGDLGLSKAKCQTLISGGVRGTLPWMAPELLNGSTTLVTEKVDVFSFGIVMWELLTGEEPYADLHYEAIIGGIVSNALRPPVPETCDLDWTSLMERCWSSELSIRPNFTEIADELRAMANKLPSKGQLQHANNPQPKT